MRFVIPIVFVLATFATALVDDGAPFFNVLEQKTIVDDGAPF